MSKNWEESVRKKLAHPKICSFKHFLERITSLSTNKKLILRVFYVIDNRISTFKVTVKKFLAFLNYSEGELET